MQKRYALLCGAAVGVLFAGASATAQAAPKHHHHAAAAAASETQQKIDSLTDAVSTLENRLNDEAAARQADEARAQAAEAKADAAEADAQATRSEMQAQIQTIPGDVQTAIAANAPKPSDKAYYKGVTLTLGGFLEAAGIYRSKSLDSDIASNFAKIPLGNNAVGHTQELRGTARQSRLSLLAQGDINPTTQASFYTEMDFLGAAQTANSNSTNSFNLRIRNVYGTLDWNDLGWHLLAGQNWSLVTMNAKGITPRNEVTPPSIDAQYIPGFAFARQPQLRLTHDFDDHQFWAAVSIENPQTTFSGSTVAGVNAFTGATGSSLITSASAGQSASSGFTNINTFSLNHVPDVIAKIAFEPNIGGAHPVHLELFGLYRDYYDRINVGANAFGLPTGISNSDVSGGGVGGGVIVNVIPKMLDIQGSFLTGSGIGRYGAAGLPDVTLHPNGKIEPIPETMWLGGATFHATPALDVYLFGGEESETAKPFNATNTGGATTHIGYGNPFLSNAGCLSEAATGASALTCTGTVKSVDQVTAGFWDKVYSGRYGYVRVGVQYSHTDLDTFAGANAAGVPGSLAPKTSDDMVFTSFRYYPF
ncbi:MAG TPA: hypothetical protein VHZ26_02570 [Caulobacteraceae bacterium]|jgi:hypothetical protein|nr:hypothetical protein [Caulobacteraceae bacterium]